MAQLSVSGTKEGNNCTEDCFSPLQYCQSSVGGFYAVLVLYNANTCERVSAFASVAFFLSSLLFIPDCSITVQLVLCGCFVTIIKCINLGKESARRREGKGELDFIDVDQMSCSSGSGKQLPQSSFLSCSISVTVSRAKC